MGRIKSRLRSQVASVTIASMFIAQTIVALPPQERKSSGFSSEHVGSLPDVANRVPLIYRDIGESGGNHVRYREEVEMTAAFESGRSNSKAQVPEDGLGGPDESELRPSNLGRLAPFNEDERPHVQTQERTNDPGDVNTLGRFNAPIPPTTDGGEQHGYRRDHHHSHHPDDHSRGGHSEHWFEHHCGLTAASYHRHHHHHHHHHGHHHRHNRQRGKGPGPSRLAQTKAIDDDAAILIAPPSAHSTTAHFTEAEEGEGTLRSRTIDRITKRETGRDAMILDGEPTLGDSAWFSEVHRDRPDKRRALKDGHIVDGVPGIIDLMRGSPNGEKLGGLSISSLPPNDTSPISASKLFVLLIDSTPNLIDQATFSMHTFEDQSILNHEALSTRATRDLLVALEVPHRSNTSLPQRMCATFNPLEVDIQMFGLALCMDQDSATNNRRMSQAFRYSPDSGMLAPYYGAEGARESVLAAVNERIQAMESSNDDPPTNQTGWNGTGIYDLDPNAPTLPLDWANHAVSGLDFDSAAILEAGNSTYQSHSELYPRSISSLASATTEMERNLRTMTAMTSTPTPLLSVHGASTPDHAFIIGEPAGDTASTASTGSSLGVIMVFRSNMDSSSWCRTEQDVDTPAERQKSLENYQEIGVASKNATALDHWAVIDKIQPNSSKANSKGNGSGSISNKPRHVASESPNATKIKTPVGYWSDSGTSQSSSEGQAADDVQPNEDGIISNANVDDDPTPPKPVLNVAYFGDSGRSAPVPPDQQADFARPILVADPLAKPHTTSKSAAPPKDPGKEKVSAGDLTSSSYL